MVKTTRDDIGIATCKRLLGASSGITGVHVAAAAAKQAQEALELVLENGGKKLTEFLSVGKTKTVTVKLVEMCFVGKCMGVTANDLLLNRRKGNTRGLPITAIDRILRRSLPADARISETAKKALVGVAEAYLRVLGRNSGLMASAGKRITIQEADVISARKLQM